VAHEFLMTARVVIDNHVLLDFWVFADTLCRALHERCLPAACGSRAAMHRRELIEVLARPAFDCARARRADGFQADLSAGATAQYRCAHRALFLAL